MNIQEATATMRICRELEGQPFNPAILEPLEYLRRRAYSALGAGPQEAPVFIPMDEEFAVEIEDHHGQWLLVRAEGEAGWVPSVLEAKRIAGHWAAFPSKRPTRIVKRFVTDREVTEL